MEIKNARCTDFIRDFISIFDGQYLVYHNGWVNNAEWYNRWNQEIQENKKFYLIGSGNDGDYSDELLIEIDKILKEYKPKNYVSLKQVCISTNHIINAARDGFLINNMLIRAYE